MYTHELADSVVKLGGMPQEEDFEVDTPVTRMEKEMVRHAGMEGQGDESPQWRTIAQRVVHGQTPPLNSLGTATGGTGSQREAPSRSRLRLSFEKVHPGFDIFATPDPTLSRRVGPMCAFS